LVLYPHYHAYTVVVCPIHLLLVLDTQFLCILAVLTTKHLGFAFLPSQLFFQVVYLSLQDDVLFFQRLRLFVSFCNRRFLLDLVSEVGANSSLNSALPFTCQKIDINIVNKLNFITSLVSWAWTWSILTLLGTDGPRPLGFAFIHSYLWKLDINNKIIIRLNGHLQKWTNLWVSESSGATLSAGF